MMQYTDLDLEAAARGLSTMPRRVFLAYPCDFPEHEAVQAVCGFLQSKGCIISIPPSARWTYYSAMEAAIEQCDAFVAVLDPIVKDGSSQLAVHLNYAAGLHRMRWHPRPRIFGLWLGPPKEGSFSDWPLERLDQSKLSLLLEDLPQR